MKKIFFRLCFVSFFIFLLNQSYLKAQNLDSEYTTSVGFKVLFGDGTVGGFNVKHFVNDYGALEGSFLFFDGPLIGLDFLYLYHGDIGNADGLKWYVGGGGLILIVTESGYQDNFGFALRPVMGLDYKFTGAPINLALDLNPIFSIVPTTEVDFAVGLTFRYAF